jgi:hypothetical protein
MLSRVTRFLGLDRNPLRRRVDRVEAWLSLLLTATFLVAGPAVAWYAGGAAYHNAARVARDEQRERVQVNAVLEAEAKVAYSGSDDSPGAQEPVQARWQGPDGTTHRGMIVPDRPGPVGTVVRVWTDRVGRLTDPPQTVGSGRVNGIAIGVLALMVMGGMLAGVALLIRQVANRRRLVWWQGEWTVVEPRWTGRR